MPNMNHHISRHNTAISKHAVQPVQGEPLCNCRVGTEECPVRGQCLKSSVIYRATVETSHRTETYTGLTGGSFKARYDKHTFDFRHREMEHSTTLSTYIWKLKDSKTKYKISWRIMDRAPCFNPITRTCRLCLKEKYYIMFKPDCATNFTQLSDTGSVRQLPGKVNT